MRRLTLLFIFAASCGDGGPARISVPDINEVTGIFGPRFELAGVRVGERPSTGFGVSEATAALNDIASRCELICVRASGCFEDNNNNNNVDRCIEGCTEQTVEGPAACALPTLDALICAVDAICSGALGVFDRTRDWVLSCNLELGEVIATEPTPFPSNIDFCRLPNF